MVGEGGATDVTKLGVVGTGGAGEEVAGVSQGFVGDGGASDVIKDGVVGTGGV